MLIRFTSIRPDVFARRRHARDAALLLTVMLAGTITRVTAQQPTVSSDAVPPITLTMLVNRAVAWVHDYQHQLSAVAFEEQFEQRTAGRGSRVSRTTRSDLTILHLPRQDVWLPFRDVFEVNGKLLRDRDERLQRLFLESPAKALEEARRLTRESSRYNLGSVERTINVPTFALHLLLPANAGRSEFALAGTAVVGGVETSVVRFVERGRPTVVRTARGGDIPMQGALWIEPATGRIHKTLVKTEGSPDPGEPPPPLGTRDILMHAEVTYAADETLGLWMPSEMREWARGPNGAEVIGVARYGRPRRFKVDTRFTTQ